MIGQTGLFSPTPPGGALSPSVAIGLEHSGGARIGQSQAATEVLQGPLAYAVLVCKVPELPQQSNLGFTTVRLRITMIGIESCVDRLIHSDRHGSAFDSPSGRQAYLR